MLCFYRSLLILYFVLYFICILCSKAQYTLATKLNSTRSTSLKVDKVERVALAPYTLATESTVSATKSTKLATTSTATSCRIQVVTDLSPKPTTKSTISATVDFVADLAPVSATVHFVTSVYLT